MVESIAGPIIRTARSAVFSVETWPRLFLAASGLAAGALFDIRERRYMGFIMFAVTALSTISSWPLRPGQAP